MPAITSCRINNGHVGDQIKRRLIESLINTLIRTFACASLNFSVCIRVTHDTIAPGTWRDQTRIQRRREK